MEKMSYKKLEEFGACKAGLRWFNDVFGFDGEATFDELLRCVS